MVPSHTTRRILLWVAALATVVRLLYLAEHVGSPFFAVPLLDGKYYDTLARALLAGQDVTGINPGFRPFLYPTLLAGLYQAGGDLGPVLALVGQHLLGIVTAMLVAWLALRLYRRPAAGVLAGVLYALAPLPLFFEGELLITCLFSFLVLAPVAVLSADGERPQILRWALAGALVGLAVQARPNALLFLPAFPLAAWIWRSRSGILRAALAAWGGAGMVLVLAAWLQQPVLDRFQLLPSSGGVNFYLGNKAGADGMIPRQDHGVSYGNEYRDSVQLFAREVFEEETGKASATPSEISGFWWRRTLQEVAGDPIRWLGHLGRKLAFVGWNREIPNNKSFAFIRQEESRWLGTLPVAWWMIFALAPLGLFEAWRKGDRQVVFWLLAAAVALVLTMVLFFVNARYRAPLWPPMTVLAAGGLLAWFDVARRGPRQRLAGYSLGILLAGVVSCVNWFDVPDPGFARDYFFRSLARQQAEDLEGALADARHSVALETSDPAAWTQVGNLAAALKDEELAYESYRAAAELAPREPRIYNNLSVLHERTGRPGDAYRGYLFAIFLSEDYAPPLVNAALLELRAGLWSQAAERVRRAEELGFDDVTLDCARAFLAAAAGDAEEASRWLTKAQSEDPVTTDRLVRDHQQRLPVEALQAGLPPPVES